MTGSRSPNSTKTASRLAITLGTTFSYGESDRLPEQVEAINRRCKEHGIPKPEFCLPGQLA